MQIKDLYMESGKDFFVRSRRRPERNNQYRSVIIIIIRRLLFSLLRTIQPQKPLTTAPSEYK